MAAGRKTGGRQKGTRNAVTQGAKANIMKVFEMLGGAQGFAEWARDNQTEFYRHYAKLIPVTLAGDENNPIVINKIVREVVHTKDSNS